MGFDCTPEAITIRKRISEYEKIVSAGLDSEHKVMLYDTIDLYSELLDIVKENAYSTGLKNGAQLMLDILHTPDDIPKLS